MVSVGHYHAPAFGMNMFDVRQHGTLREVLKQNIFLYFPDTVPRLLTSLIMSRLAHCPALTTPLPWMRITILFLFLISGLQKMKDLGSSDPTATLSRPPWVSSRLYTSLSMISPISSYLLWLSDRFSWTSNLNPSSVVFPSASTSFSCPNLKW